MVNMTCPTIPDKPTDPKPFFANGEIDFKAHDVGWLVCGIMALIATISSAWLIWKHLTYYTCPTQQRHIVRLLIMVPIYAIVSFMSYLFYEEALYYQTIRDCYEAVLVTSFFYLILAYTGDTRAEQHAVFRNIDLSGRFWVWPLGSWKYRPEGLHFLWLMKICVLQYAIIRPLCTFVAVGTQYFGYYCLHSWMPWFTHVWCAFFISVSVTVAMYCLIQLYMPVKKLVDPYKPILKFLSIKTIVFLTFWQDTLLSFLVSFGAIKETEYFTAEQIQAGINALLQCFWMLLFGFIHIKAFSYLPYRPEDRSRTTLRGKALLDSLDFRDWFYEMKESTRYIAARSKGRNYTLAEDLRAQRHEHLLNALGKQRDANLEIEIDMEKANMPTFWKNPEDAQFWTPSNESKNGSSIVKSRTADDAYSPVPSPARAAGRQASKHDSGGGGDARAQRAAELQRLVAELDLQNVDESIVGVQDHDYGFQDERYERAALMRQPARGDTDLGSPQKDDDKHPELTQYHVATVPLANVPSLTYDDESSPHDSTAALEAGEVQHPRHTSRTAPGVGAFGIASWFGWNSAAPQDPPQRTDTANMGYLRPGEAYGADAQPRSPDAEGTGWWRNYWDRVSYAGSHEPSVFGDDEEEKEAMTATRPAVMRQVTAGSWGMENTQRGIDGQRSIESAARPLPAPPGLKINTEAQHCGEASMDTTTSPSSRISPHADSPLSRLIQTSRDSFSSLNRDEIREQLGGSLSSRRVVTKPTIREVSRPPVAPRASSFAVASSKQASVSRVTSTTRSGGAAPSNGVQQALEVMSSSTSTHSKHPIVFADALVEHPVAEIETAATVAAPTKTLPPAVGPKGKLFNLVLPSPLSPARYPYGKEGPSGAGQNANEGAKPHHELAAAGEGNGDEAGGTLKWAKQSKPIKQPSEAEASSIEGRIDLPKGKNVITVGGMSLAQAKAARGKAEAEARAQAQAQQQQESQRQQSQQNPQPLAAPKSILIDPASNKPTGRLMLPAPSKFASNEDPYLAGRSATAAPASTPPRGGKRTASVTTSGQTRTSSTTFEVGSIVARSAVVRASLPANAPLKGYYDSISRSHSFIPSLHSSPPPLPAPQHSPQRYGQYAQQFQHPRPAPTPSQHRQPPPPPPPPHSQFQFEYYRD